MRYGIVILVNDDVHAVFETPHEIVPRGMDRMRDELKACKESDEVKSIRIQRCDIQLVHDADEIIAEVKRNFL